MTGEEPRAGEPTAARVRLRLLHTTFLLCFVVDRSTFGHADK